MKRIESNPTSSFTRNVQSNNPQAIKKYKRKLEIHIKTFNIKEREKLYNIVKINKLNNNDEKELNQIDADITISMLNTEKSILTQHYTHPWSPALHRAIRKVTTWKVILSQLKTGYNQQKQIKKLQKKVTPIIDTTWTTIKTSNRISTQRKNNLKT